MGKNITVEKPKENVTRKFYSVMVKDGKYITEEVPEKAYMPVVMIHKNRTLILEQARKAIFVKTFMGCPRVFFVFL